MTSFAMRASTRVYSRPISARVRSAWDAIAAWRERARQRADLSAMGARELRDIGITRTDVQRECAKPFWRA